MKTRVVGKLRPPAGRVAPGIRGPLRPGSAAPRDCALARDHISSGLSRPPRAVPSHGCASVAGEFAEFGTCATLTRARASILCAPAHFAPGWELVKVERAIPRFGRRKPEKSLNHACSCGMWHNAVSLQWPDHDATIKHRGGKWLKVGKGVTRWRPTWRTVWFPARSVVSCS